MDKKIPGIGNIFADWWENCLGTDDGTSRKVRACLRRCTTPIEAALIEEVHKLNFLLKQKGYTKLKPDRLALVAISLSHVKKAGGIKLAEFFGKCEGTSNSRVLSKKRFQTLIKTTDRVELIRPIRRSISIVKNEQININALAEDLFWWDEEVRFEWCKQYFGASNQMKSQSEKENNQ